MKNDVCAILNLESGLKNLKENILSLNSIEPIKELHIISNYFSIVSLNSILDDMPVVNIPIIKIKKYFNRIDAINNIIQKSSSIFSIIIDDREFLEKHVLLKLLDIFRINNSLKLIYTHSIYKNNNGEFLSFNPAIDPINFKYKKSFIRPINNSSVIFRNELISNIGLLNNNLNFYYVFDLINRTYKENKNFVKMVNENLSVILLEKIEDYIANDIDKLIEFLDLLNKLKNQNTQYIEKKIANLIYKNVGDMEFQKINKSNLSIFTANKIQTIYEKIKLDPTINKEFIEIGSDKPKQLKMILNSRLDLQNKNFHLAKNEREFCQWILKFGFKEYPPLLNYLDSCETVEWLNSNRKGDDISRINLAIIDSNKIFRFIFGDKKYHKFFTIFINIFWNFLPYRLPKKKLVKKFYNKSKKILEEKNLKISKSGVNLIGYAKHALGIGEDLRTTTYALNSRNIDTAIINFSPGSFKGREERTFENRIQNKHPYQTTIICLTAEETLRYLMREGSKNLKDRYVIGYWPWELPNWPKSWISAIDYVNEIWVSSKHIKDSLDKETKKPIKIMPLCVDQDGYKLYQQGTQERLENRKRFGMDLGTINVCYSFDQNSYIDRKNPLDAFRTFQLAFPPYPLDKVNEQVKLLIKTFPNKNVSWEWQYLKDMAKFDSRVEIIESNMNRKDLMRFYGCCDIFLSLHRAEGYGRCLAESLQLGLDLIATDWSGNKDFCKGELYTPVPYKLIPLNPFEYPYWEEQFWAEPDIIEASKILREVVYKRQKNGLPNEKISKGYQRYFSALKCGERYKKRLEELNLLI